MNHLPTIGISGVNWLLVSGSVLSILVSINSIDSDPMTFRYKTFGPFLLKDPPTPETSDLHLTFLFERSIYIQVIELKCFL